tara:strand:- start:16429 stop:16698 length:270 start_codon:yes stop_codon:yes gene_type:complete
MTNLKSKIYSLDVPDNIKAMLLNRVSKIKGSKVLISGNNVEIVPKYYKEYSKGLNGRYYATNVYNMKWLNLDNRFKENLILVDKHCYLH